MPLELNSVSYNEAPLALVNSAKTFSNPIDSSWLEKTIFQLFKNGSPKTPENSYISSFLNANNILISGPKFEFGDPKTRVGIEVEVENVAHINPNIPLCFWEIAEDGSLRNHGKEFKTYAIPLQYSQVALEQLFQGLNPDIDFSQRTSIHVHIDVRKLTINELLGLLFTYTVIENLLFKFVGANRRNSIFCTPITETELLSGLDITSIENLLNHVQNVWQKYSALNILPIQNFGTVEFRQLPGTNDIMKICVWLELLSRLKVFTYKHPLAYIIDTINQLNNNSQYYKFVESIFGPYITYLDTTNLISDMEKAVYMCKTCTIANKFHQEIIKTPVQETSYLRKLFPVTEQVKNLMSDSLYAIFIKYHAHYGPFQTELESLQLFNEQLLTLKQIHPQDMRLWNIIGALKEQGRI